MTLLACSAAHSSGRATTETPASRARKIRKLSEEFESVKSAMIKRNLLKFPSKPCNENVRGVGFGDGVWRRRDSRMKNMATNTAASPGTDADKNIFVNSFALGALRLTTNK